MRTCGIRVDRIALPGPLGGPRALRLLVCCLGAAAVLGGCGRSVDSGAPPAVKHVIFVSIDTARADHFGFMGSTEVETPRLDALAAESVVFEDFMTPVALTLPTHVSLLTGKYPHHHGVPRNGFMVNLLNEMLPEILGESGFVTAGFAGSFVLSDAFDFAQGFDHYDEDLESYVDAKHSQRRAEDVTDAIIEYLDETGVPDRLFLFAHYYDPHRPYSPPPPFETMYDPVGRVGLPGVPQLLSNQSYSEETRDRLVARLALQYAGEISYTDHHIGRLMDYLRETGILENALVVVTTDHGESLWEHGENFDHGWEVYDSTIRAVCLMRFPGGWSGGLRPEELVSIIDVMPTVLGYLGLPLPDGIDGEPIPVSLLAGGIGDRVRFAEAGKPTNRYETDPRWRNTLKPQCVREGRHKFIVKPYAGGEELYDLDADPNETRNLLENPSPEMTQLAARLRETLSVWTDSAEPLPSRFGAGEVQDGIRRLRSLGYLN